MARALFTCSQPGGRHGRPQVAAGSTGSRVEGERGSLSAGAPAVAHACRIACRCAGSPRACAPRQPRCCSRLSGCRAPQRRAAPTCVCSARRCRKPSARSGSTGRGAAGEGGGGHRRVSQAASEPGQGMAACAAAWAADITQQAMQRWRPQARPTCASATPHRARMPLSWPSLRWPGSCRRRVGAAGARNFAHGLPSPSQPAVARPQAGRTKQQVAAKLSSRSRASPTQQAPAPGR